MEFYLTKERLEELKKELEELKNVALPKVAEQLKRAKEFGDLSENSEYQAARSERENIESRIEEIDAILRNPVIIEKKFGSDEVSIGATLEITREGGKSLTLTIVGSNEAKPQEGLISNVSPLGRALLGHRVGSSVEVETPNGKVTYTITKIR
ncbi:MAG: transcription elongation factor GreA [Patescibacteria group bacterium]|nr:transcription elongation factor GreA [Patescibacteria group bacterium]MCL5224409.1 transcription elongation factor GreA [Patescibacteria group bacterium]